MYRILLVTVAFRLAVTQQGSESVYKPGKEYTYEYETQIVTGIPQGSTIYSSLKLHTFVRVQFQTASRVLLQFERLKLMKINEPIESVDPTKQQIPEDMYHPLTGKEFTEMTTQLSKPLKFKYIRGHVSDISTESDDPYWSLNIKRGLLSFFEINLDERRSLRSASKQVHLNRLPTDQYKLYSVMEPSVAGDCETLYRIKPKTSADGEPFISIQKVRNYENCLERPRLTRTLFRGYHCSQCEKDKTEPLKGATQFRYTIMGSSRRFLIQSIIAESQYWYTPYSDEGGTVVTFVNQTFNLIKSNKVQQSIQEPTQPQQQKQGLRAIVPEIENDPMRQPQEVSTSQPESAIPQEDQSRVKTKITKLLKMLESYSKDYIKEEAGPLMISLVEEMRKAKTNTLQEIFDEYKKENNPQRYSRGGKFLSDLLPATGTSAAMDVLAKAIINGKFMGYDAVFALNFMTITTEPDVNIAKRILEIIKSNACSTSPTLKRSAYLFLGAFGEKMKEKTRRLSRDLQRREQIIRRLLQTETQKHIVQSLKSNRVVIQDKRQKHEKIYSQIKQEIIMEIQGLLKSTSYDDRVLALKTIGNTGFKEFIPDAQTILDDKSQPVMLRTQAIYSFRKLSLETPKPIQELLLPRFFDQSEEEEIRIGAYLITTETHPGLPILQMIAQSLQRETNPHVGTFVYSHLAGISNSTHPCLMSMAKNATYALKFAKKFSPSFHYSRYTHIPYYNDKLKMGGALSMGLVSSPKEFAPRAGSALFNFQMYGYSVNFAEVGFHAEGLQTLLSKVLVPPKQQRKDSSASTRGGVPKVPKDQKDDVKQTQKILNVSQRESPETKGHMYLKMFGNELGYFQLDKDLLQRVMRQGVPRGQNSQSESPLNFHKSMIFGDLNHVIITDAGLPLRLKLRGSASLKWDGKVSLLQQPNSSDGRQRSTIGFDYNVKPSFVMDISGEMEVDAFYYKSGLTLKSLTQGQSSPSFSISVDVRKAKAFTKLNVETLKPLTKITTCPMTFVRRDPYDISEYPTIPDVKEINVMNGAVLKPFSVVYGSDIAGLDITFKGQAVTGNGIRGVPYYPYAGKQETYFTITPGKKPQKFFELQFQLINSERRQGPQPESASDKPEEKSSDDQSWSDWAWSMFDKGESQDSTSSNESMSHLPLNIRATDVSIESVVKSLVSSQMKADFTKSAFLVNMLGYDTESSPIRHAQFSFLYERDRVPGKYSCYMKFKRSPMPGIETKKWEVDMKADLDYHGFKAEPSKLMRQSSQERVQRQIQDYLQEDGLHHLRSRVSQIIPSQQSKQWRRLHSSSSIRQIIIEIVKDLVRQSPQSQNSKVQELSKILREQILASRQSDKLRQLSYDPLRIHRSQQQVMKLVNAGNEIRSRITRELDSSPSQVAEPQRRILLKAIVLKQIQIHRKVSQIVSSIQQVLSRQQQGDLKQKLTLHQQSLDDIVQKQLKKLPASDVSQSKSQSQNSQQVPLSKSIQSLLQKQEQELNLLTSSKPSRRPQIEDVIKKAKAVNKQIEDIVSNSQPQDMDKDIRSQLLEAGIQQEIIAETLQTLTRSREQQTDSAVQEGLKSQRQLELLRRETRPIITVLAQVQSNSMEIDSLSKSTQSMQPDLLRTVRQLQKAQLLQVIAVNRLQIPSIDRAPLGIDNKQIVESLSQSLKQAQSAMQIIQSSLPKVKQNIVPQLIIKILQRSQMQVQLLGEIHDKALAEISRVLSKQKAVDSRLESIKLMSEQNKLKAMSLQDQVLSSLKNPSRRADQVLTSQRNPSSLSGSDQIAMQKVQQTIKEVKQEQKLQHDQIKATQQNPPQSTSELSQKSKELLNKMEKTKDKVERAQQVVKSNKLHQKVKSMLKQLKEVLTSHASNLQRLESAILGKQLPASKQGEKSVQEKVRSLKSSVQRLQQEQQQMAADEVPSTSDSSVSSQSQSQQMPPQKGSQQTTQQQPRSQPLPRDPRVQSDDRYIKMMVKVNFGYSEGPLKTMTIQMLAKKSLEQLLWEQSQSSPILRSSSIRESLEGRMDPQRSAQLQDKLDMLNHFHFTITYKKDEIPDYTRRHLWEFQEFFKAGWYSYLYLDMPEPSYNNKYEVIFDFGQNNRKLNMDIKTPYEINRFQDVPTPSYLNKFMEFLWSLRYHYPNSLQQSLATLTKRLPGKCEIDRDQVRTLDQKQYTVPDMKECDAVLAMDCSSSQTFAVKTRKDSSDPSKRVVTVSLEGRNIEIIPDGQKGVRVSVNGKRQELKEKIPKLIRQDAPKGSHRPILVEMLKQDKQVRVNALREGIQVHSDGRKIRLQVSPLHYSKVCGLCGNYDGQSNNDYQSPSMEDLSDPTCFAVQYALSKGKCDAKDVRKQCKNPPQSTQSRRCQVKEETIRRTRLENKQPQICFSTVPVKKCRPGCQPSDQKSVPVSMHCVNQSKPEAARLEQKSYLRPLTELKDKPADYTEHVLEPKMCKPQ